MSVRGRNAAKQKSENMRMIQILRVKVTSNRQHKEQQMDKGQPLEEACGPKVLLLDGSNTTLGMESCRFLALFILAGVYRSRGDSPEGPWDAEAGDWELEPRCLCRGHPDPWRQAGSSRPWVGPVVEQLPCLHSPGPMKSVWALTMQIETGDTSGHVHQAEGLQCV